MVDYDSDEDEDEDDDEDEEDVGEDEDVVEDEEEDGVDSLEEGLLSPASLGGTVGTTKPNVKEDLTLTDTSKEDIITKDIKFIPNESSSLPSVTISKNQLLTSNDKVTGIQNIDDNEQVGSKEEHATLSDTTADTHDRKQSLAQDCSYSIVQNNLDSHKPALHTNENVSKNEYEFEKKNISSVEKTTVDATRLNIAQVAGNGDGEVVAGVNSLVRSSEDLSDDSDDRPAAKRQKLCSVENQEGAGDMNDKKEDLLGASEVK